MSKNLRQCMKLMNVFYNTKSPKARASILNEMSRHECYFKALFEIIDNIHAGNLVSNKKTKVKLRRCIRFMEAVFKKPKSRRKRAALVKSQRANGFFLSAIIPLLTTVVGKLI